MMLHLQHSLGLEFPVPPAVAVPVRVQEVPADESSPAPSRELWAAVQLGQRSQIAQDPDGARAALAALVSRAHTLTSRVTIEAPDAVLLEVAGSQRLFGGLSALLAALRGTFARPLQLALAPTPLAAVLLARAGRNCCITTPARLAGRLAPLPLSHLHWADEEGERLRSMGVATLGDLLRLPRAGLARRIGAARLAQLDRLVGARPDLRVELRPSPRFGERIDADFETTDCERLLAGLAPALARLEDFLRARQRGVMALRILLHHRRAAPTTCLVRCVVPEYRASRFAALLAARLEATRLGGPVRYMELAAGRLRPWRGDNAGLWSPGEQGGGAAALQMPEFLHTLMARLGENAVQGLAAVDAHRPEHQYRIVPPALAPRRGAATSLPAGAARPLGLLAEPLPIECRCDAAGKVQQLRHAGQVLCLITGPERIESGWWDGGDVRRDYYVARTADGAQWWVFRECGAHRRWFVHGCFA